MINCFQFRIFLIFQQEKSEPIQVLATSVMLLLVITQDPLVQGAALTLVDVRRKIRLTDHIGRSNGCVHVHIIYLRVLIFPVNVSFLYSQRSLTIFD